MTHGVPSHNIDPFSMEAFSPASSETLRLLDETLDGIKPFAGHEQTESLEQEYRGEDQSDTLVVYASSRQAAETQDTTMHFTLPDVGLTVSVDSSHHDTLDYLLQASQVESRANALAAGLPEIDTQWLGRAASLLGVKAEDKDGKVRELLKAAPYDTTKHESWFLNRTLPDGISVNYNSTDGNPAWMDAWSQTGMALESISIYTPEERSSKIFHYNRYADGRRELDTRILSSAESDFSKAAFEQHREARSQGVMALTEAKAKDFITALQVVKNTLASGQ